MITDLHFGARNDSPQFLDFYDKFYTNTFFPKLKEENIDTLLILGDVFDRRKYINFNSLKRSKDIFFDKLRDNGIKSYIIVGNHDTYFKNTNEVNSIRLLLSEYDNIHIIENPQTIKILDTDVCTIPWICTDNYQSAMDEIKNTKASICAGHFEIVGFEMYRGHPCEEGLSRDLFRRFSYTFSGHYHHKSNSDGIHYLGNPYELTWQDYGDDRGFHILDLDTGDLTFHINPYIIFHKIYYNDKNEDIPPVKDEYKDAFVKVVVVNKNNPYKFDKFINDLNAISPLDLSIIEDYSILSEGVDDDMVDQAEDTLTILNKYVENVSRDDIDISKLKNIFRELYVEALNSNDSI